MPAQTDTLYQNRYRIPSTRATWWDYAAPGSYFITFCTAQRRHLFGCVQRGQMHLSPLGEIARAEWERSFAIRAELACDVYVIMPNHIHAIVRIIEPVETHGCTGETHSRASLLHGCASPPNGHSPATRPPKSVSSFVAGFKSATTTRINAYRHTPSVPVWQPRFHDHIIRHDLAYQRIMAYIRNNPARWERDRFYRERK